MSGWGVVRNIEVGDFTPTDGIELSGSVGNHSVCKGHKEEHHRDALHCKTYKALKPTGLSQGHAPHPNWSALSPSAHQNRDYIG